MMISGEETQGNEATNTGGNWHSKLKRYVDVHVQMHSNHTHRYSPSIATATFILSTVLKYLCFT